MKIGVIGFQGDVSEHCAMLRQVGVTPLVVRRLNEMNDIDGVIIPGGESTTISKQMSETGIFDELVKRGKNGFPIYGTCAGLILLAKEGDAQVAQTQQRLMGLMNMAVNRNAFGRQIDSFERDILLAPFEKPFHCVFIRAPLITRVWGNVQVLGKIPEGIVMAREGNLLATAFHPELTNDRRIHDYFVRIVRSYKK